MKQVVIAQPRLTRYREPLFEALRHRCQAMGIDLHLVHGQTGTQDKQKRDEGHLPWAHRVNNRIITIAGRELVWQSMPKVVSNADLTIITQENRLLSNYPLLLSRLWSPRRVAYFGHGANFQSAHPDGLREGWKRFLLTRVDAWFGYTERSREILLAAGYPDERITVLNNAIDTRAFRAQLDGVTVEMLKAQRIKVGAGETAPIGLFCGSLYADKRLAFLIAAAERIRAAIPDFQLLIVGDGPARGELETLVAHKPWIHMLGALHGPDKAACFRLANIVLNPGLVGLHILDAFCAGLPLVTTAEASHSPEIAYLEPGRNGFLVTGDATRYGDEVIALLRQPQRLAEACSEALAAARCYTLDAMVNNFADGIARCIEQDTYASA
jgi:glycosyltransferase involved in cell wall biosynthesis